MDLIDRGKLIKALGIDRECECCQYAVGNYLCGCDISHADICEAIVDAPTIEVPKWIPCSERLPEKSGDYLVCPIDSVLEDYSDFDEVMIMPYDADCEAFGWWTERYDPISLGFVDSDFNEFEVIAWMPLPKPYGERKDNGKDL